MKRVLVSMTVVAVGLVLAPRALAQTADEIVEKHLAALGGRAALSKITTQVASGTISIAAQNADLPGTIEVSRRAPNKVRTLMKLDLSGVGGSEMILDQRCDGKAGFVSNSLQGDREIGGDQLQAMLNASYPSPLLTYKDAGGTVEFQGRDAVGGRPMFVLAYAPKAGPGSKMYIDAETYLLARAITTLNVPEAGGAVEQISDASDYRAVDGIKVPFSITQTSPSQVITITLSKVQLNVALDDAIFSRPAAK